MDRHLSLRVAVDTICCKQVPKLPKVIRGWCFAVNFTNTPTNGLIPETLYPNGTVNFAPDLYDYECSPESAARGITTLVDAQGWSDDASVPHTANDSIADFAATVAHFKQSTLLDYSKVTQRCRGVGINENLPYEHFKGERAAAAQGFREARHDIRTGARPPQLIASWSPNLGDELFASLMADGTFDLAMLEGMTYNPDPGWNHDGSCTPGGILPRGCSNTSDVSAYFPHLQWARDRGFSNRTAFCFGIILGKSALNPNGWTEGHLRSAMLALKGAFPELASVIMMGADPHATPANNASRLWTAETDRATAGVILSAGRLMQELWPDR